MQLLLIEVGPRNACMFVNTGHTLMADAVNQLYGGVHDFGVFDPVTYRERRCHATEHR